MQVVVALEEAGAGGGYEGLEERRWARSGCQTETGCAEVGEEAFEETDLGSMSVERARNGRRGIWARRQGNG